MLLHRIEWRDFRSQQEAVLDLVGPDGKPVRVMALIGPNGNGKTAWLDAIAGFFTVLLPDYQGPRLVPADVRDAAVSADVRVLWSEDDEPHGGTLTIQRAASIEYDPESRRPVSRRFISGDARFETERRHWGKTFSTASRAPSGVLVYFDTHRFTPRRRISGPNPSFVARHRAEGALAPAFVPAALGSRHRFERLCQWIVNVEFQRARAMADRGEALPLWVHLVSVLDRLLSPCRFERVSEDFEVLFRTPSGVVPIERLSSGYQSVLVIATELLLRLSLAVDDTARMFDVDAVCLIDEIDAHLHPLWQTRILDDLRWAFPRVQFIVTTHSEHIIAGLRPFEISVLQESAP